MRFTGVRASLDYDQCVYVAYTVVDDATQAVRKLLVYCSRPLDTAYNKVTHKLVNYYAHVVNKTLMNKGVTYGS